MNTQTYDNSALGSLPPLIDPSTVAGPSSYAQHPSNSPPQRGHSENEPRSGNGAKRRSLVADESEDSGTGRQKSREATKKKKKAARACFHCQKAHLTCDDCEYPSMLHIYNAGSGDSLTTVNLPDWHSPSLSAMYQTWSCRQLYGRPAQEGQVSA